MHRHAAAAAQILDRAIGPPRDQPLRRLALQSLDLAQAEPQRG